MWIQLTPHIKLHESPPIATAHMLNIRHMLKYLSGVGLWLISKDYTNMSQQAVSHRKKTTTTKKTLCVPLITSLIIFKSINELEYVESVPYLLPFTSTTTKLVKPLIYTDSFYNYKGTISPCSYLKQQYKFLAAQLSYFIYSLLQQVQKFSI